MQTLLRACTKEDQPLQAMRQRQGRTKQRGPGMHMKAGRLCSRSQLTAVQQLNCQKMHSSTARRPCMQSHEFAAIGRLACCNHGCCPPCCFICCACCLPPRCPSAASTVWADPARPVPAPASRPLLLLLPPAAAKGAPVGRPAVGQASGAKCCSGAARLSDPAAGQSSPMAVPGARPPGPLTLRSPRASTRACSCSAPAASQRPRACRGG